MPAETMLGQGKSATTIIYEGMSKNEAVVAGLHYGLIPLRDDPNKFVHIHGYNPKEVLATLTREGSRFVLATTPDYHGPNIRRFTPTQEGLAEFIATDYLSLLRGGGFKLNPMGIHPTEFNANIGDILQIQLRDGHEIMGYVSKRGTEKFQLSQMDTIQESKRILTPIHSTIGTFSLEDLVHYTSLIPTIAVTPEFNVGMPVCAIESARIPRHTAGFIAYFLPNGYVVLNAYNPLKESSRPEEERKSYVFERGRTGDPIHFNPNILKRLVPK